MITISTTANIGVPVSREDLETLMMAGLVYFSVPRLRFEARFTYVTPYVIETFLKKVNA